MSSMKQLAFLALAALFLAVPADASGPVLEVGAPFPAIGLPSMRDGTRRTIGDFRGRKVVLHVFASW
ncbi:MAG: hypothetical protein GY715_08265 [Planctomycetes bacterium]|nr:hypothetical protein [Planctomycetota bacterium]